MCLIDSSMTDSHCSSLLLKYLGPPPPRNPPGGFHASSSPLLSWSIHSWGLWSFTPTPTPLPPPPFPKFLLSFISDPCPPPHSDPLLKFTVARPEKDVTMTSLDGRCAHAHRSHPDFPTTQKQFSGTQISQGSARAENSPYKNWLHNVCTCPMVSTPYHHEGSWPVVESVVACGVWSRSQWTVKWYLFNPALQSMGRRVLLATSGK